MAEPENADLTILTVELLRAFVSNNTIDSSDLAGLIQTTHAALGSINAPPPVEPTVPEFSPAVSVRKSLGSRNHILSLIDGKPYKTLKRHLSGHGLTPAEYRERYKLPTDYPMVAPAYSEHRRDVAQRLGLGRKLAKTAEPEIARPMEPEPEAAAVNTAPPLAPLAKVTRHAAAKPAQSMATPPMKPDKPAAKRLAKAAAPVTAVIDNPPPPATVSADALPQKGVPGTAKKSAPLKPAKKAAGIPPARSKPVPKPAAAKQGRAKADAAPKPTA